MFLPKIIFEDVDVLALDKPAGLSVHRDQFTTEPTLADWLLENYPTLADVGEPMLLPNGDEVVRPGIVHRLDKETSGIMIVAKNQPAFRQLKQQFVDREVKKEYRVIVVGVLKNDEGIIDLPIGRSRKDPRKRIAGKGATGVLREAVTEYQVLERFPGFVYVAAFPKTGRTHQIRVHFKAIQAPVACDELYNAGSCPEGLSRQALHAFALELTLPSGTKTRFEAPLPGDFAQTLDNLRAAC